MDRQQRVTSPTSQGADRISSPSPTSRTAKRLSGVFETDEVDARPGSPTSPSRNFSRPMSSHSSIGTATGEPKKYTHGTGSWYTQASTTTAPARPMTAEGFYRPSAPPLDLSSIANRPVSKNRISSAPGNHLARANQGQARSASVTSSIPSDDGDYITVFDKNSRTFIRTPRSQSLEPPSPSFPTRVVYDPHTRSLVSKQESTRDDSGMTVTPIQSDRVSSPVQRPRIARPADPSEDSALYPPPRNPARLPPDSGSPTSPRTHHLLHKQPSVVREDPDAEQQAEDASPISNATRGMVMGSTVQATPGPSKKYTASTTPHQRSSSLDVPRTANGTEKARNTSSSPSRSAHFSASPILKPERHIPPPRSVSPAKSALKHSPASSVRTASPIANFSPPTAASTSTVSPPSETSEGAPSQDGLDSGKKKKSARVSFDERAQEIEVPDASTSPTATSGADEDEDDAVMRPRPALPSFGSVRRNRMQPDVAEKVAEMPPERHETSSDHAIGGILRNSLEPLPPEVTSKETAGYASDESSEMEVPAVSSAANPRPAEAGAGLETKREGSEPVVKDFAKASIDEDDEGREAENADVPAINLLPPTPGIEDDSRKDLSEQEDSFKDRAKARNSMEILMPGGWGQDDESENAMAAPEPPTTERSLSSEDAAAAGTPPQDPVLHASPLQLSDIDEDTDDSAEFSDAVEDPSELDDEGGFASLDAIVESPMVSPLPVETKGQSRAIPTQELPENPTKEVLTKRPEAGDAAGADWGKATSYWSQLSREKREQMERNHMSSDDEARPTPTPAAVRKSKPKVPVAASRSTALPATRAPVTAKQESAMRKSMRAQPGPAPAPVDDGVHMRRSMRSAGGGSMATSLRQGPPPRRPQSEYVEPKGALQKKNIRPTSATSVASSSSGSAMQTQRPSSASGPKTQDSAFPALPTKKGTLQRRSEPQVSARLQRELSKADDSDSESSFKRRRRGNSGSTLDSTGRYSMRRSMRNGSIDQTPVRAPAPVEQTRPQSPDVGDRGKSGFRFRSMSPFGRNKPQAAPQLAGPRTTLRSAPPAKQSITKAAPASRAPQPSAPRFKSRFVDSDDSDEDGKPSRSYFRSRFADSDDDEPGSPATPMGLTPVRGIPRRAGRDDGDSTDLEDEEDDDPRKASRRRGKPTNAIVTDPADVEKAMAAARRNLGIPEESAPAPETEAASTPKPATEGSALARGSLRTKPEEVKDELPVTTLPQEEPVATPPEKKKRSFMGMLRRNRNSTSSVQQLRPSSPPPPMPTSPATAVKTSPPDAEQESPSSPASPASPSVGKLVRRQSDKPQPTRGNSNFSVATAPPLSSATTAVRSQDDEDWPLSSPKTEIPPVPPIPEDLTEQYPNRPRTSDGVSSDSIRLPRTMRPELAPRSRSGPQRVRIQAGEEGSEPGEREKDAGAIYSRRTGKKKKFVMLRRAFGIDD